MSVYSDNTFHKKNSNEAWSKIFNFVDPNSRILDVGCSSGRLGAALKKDKKVTVIGIDIDKKDIQLAKENLDEAHVLNIEKDSLDTLGLFDIVILADVIEHLINPIEALKKLKNVLKPGGKLIFSIPNMANGTIRLELLKGRFEYTKWGLLDKTHLHYYDQIEVDNVLKGAGFSIKKTDCTIRDIPTELIKTELAEIGLQATDRFIEHIHSPEVVTFQFIGWAIPDGKDSKIKIESRTPSDVIDKEITQISSHYNQEVDNLHTEINGLKSEIERKETERKNTAKELDRILNSKGWKMLDKAHTVKHKITKKNKETL
jgi:2-polyprenyl-3-methyl-5-hydroxy-6-metoxy-1,4-benzoquinol methylase